MPAAKADQRPSRSGRGILLWLSVLVLIGAGISLAWYGAGSLRPTISQSGLQFRTIKAGKGPTVGRTDAALLDYILAADDGTVADSSEKHGGAQPFVMDAVYPGFAEAMTHMQEGGEYRFSIPERIAWGEGQAPQGWPKGSALTFEVRVRKIVPGGAALLRQMQAQQQQQAQQPQAPQQQ